MVVLMSDVLIYEKKRGARGSLPLVRWMKLMGLHSYSLYYLLCCVKSVLKLDEI